LVNVEIGRLIVLRGMISAVSDVKLNLPKMLAAKNASVTGLTSGIESYLFKKHKIDYVKGTAKFSSPTQLNVALTEGGETMLEAKNVIIATGSEVTPFPGIEIDEKQIVSSTGALDLQEVPKKVSSPGESCLGRGLYRWGLTKLFGGMA
jgi:dihydrolipoamide dehydrogenase